MKRKAGFGVVGSAIFRRGFGALTMLLYSLSFVSGPFATQVTGASLDHFVWSAVTSPQTAGAPFNVSLTANDNAGNLVSNFSGTVTISAQMVSVPPLVISEVDNGTNNQVEFTNPSTNGVDVSGWKVAFYDSTKWPQPATTFTIPNGTICPPGSVFLIKTGGVAPGSFPNFFIGSSLSWNRFSNPVAVSLLNSTNGLVDFFCASTAFPAFVTNPTPVLPSGWYGAPVPLNANVTNTYQRQGNFNQRQAIDWLATNRTVGILNSNLSLPFTANYTPVPVLPGSISLTNGLWNGLVSIQAAGSNIVLHADNGNGNPGNSNPFDVVSGSSVTLSLPTQTSDASPGVQSAAITIPSAVGIDLIFNLTSSTPTKISVPPSVLIAAGTTSNLFSVTNFNDSILDGIQFVTITASNYLFPLAQSVITNFSLPVQLTLTLPATLNQQAGVITGQAQLSTIVPVGSNFQAELFSSDVGLLTTPSVVQIPAGQTNASFNLVAPTGAEILGNRQVIVTAFAGPAATTNGTISVLGNPSHNLTLVIPSHVTEGAGVISNASVTIAGVLPTNLTVNLSSSVPGALQVPATVTLMAGQTSVAVPITVLSNAFPSQDLLATISASAAGLIDANGTVTIQDSHLDHFGFSGIPLSQTANLPFAITILAQNESGDTLTSYSGFASLSVIGLPPGNIVPSQTGNFSNGMWSGAITIESAATNIMVGAQDGFITGLSNPFEVIPSFISTLNAFAADLIYDPVSDRIYATIPAAAPVESNTVLRLNPYTAAVEAYIPVDTNPILMALSASNEFIYIAVQGGYSVQRFNLGAQLPDLEFPITTVFPPFYAANMIGLPTNPASIAIEGVSPNGPSQDFIFDGAVQRTDLSDLALVPGLHNNGILSGGTLYLPGGLALNPTNQQPVGLFPVPGVLSIGPVAPDPGLGRVFFLSQQGGQTIIYAYDSTTFTLQGSNVIPGVLGTVQNLVRWGTNGLAFSSSGGQIFLLHSSLCPVVASAELLVSQTAPALAAVGTSLSFTINITNSGNIDASNVALYDPIPTGASFLTANSSQGSVQVNNGILTGALGVIPSNGAATVTITVMPQSVGILTNTASVATPTPDANSALESSTWLTSVTNSATSNQIAQILIQANDLVFNPANGKLYASVSGASAIFGNNIVAIDPLSLQVSNPIAVGPEPGSLALSQDGRYLYVYLKSSASFELVDLQMNTVTFQDSIYSLALSEMFVLPGNAHSLLFSQYFTGGTPSERGVQIITNGVASAITNIPGMSLIQPSLVSNVFYGYINDGVPSQVSRVQLNGSNAVSTAIGGVTYDLEPEIRSGGDLLFFSAGEVIDPEAMIRLAAFPGLNPPPITPYPTNHICPDMASGRVYYLIQNGTTATIAAYSLNNYQVTGTMQISGIVGMPEQLVRWGSNGLAFATTGGQLFSVQTPIVPSNGPADLVLTQATPSSTTLLADYSMTITVSNQGPGIATGALLTDILPTGMRFVSASPTQGTISITHGILTASLGTLNAGAVAQVSILLRPDLTGSSFNYARVAANEPDPVMTNNSSRQPVSVQISQNIPLIIGDLVYDSTRGKVFATVQGGTYSNSIIQIDPTTQVVERILPTSFVPAKIAVTGDGQFLYVGTTQDPQVARVNIQNWTNDLSFALGNDPNNIAYVAADFAPLPGQPHSVAVSMHAWYGYYTPKVAIFDDGVMRPDLLVEAGGGTYFIQASADASTLNIVNGDAALFYAVNGLTFGAYPITASGIQPAPTNITGFGADFVIQSNLLFSEDGQVLNLQSNALQNAFPASGLVAPDLDKGIVYFLVQNGFAASPIWNLVAFSATTSNILWQITIPGATGTAYSLTRCGSNTLAFATASNPNLNAGLIPTANQLFFVNTALVPAAGDLVLSATTNSAFAGANLVNTFSVLNDGPYNATGVSFTNTLANGSTFVSAASSQGTCVQSNGVVTCAIGSMQLGSTVTITVVSIVPNAGTIPLQASISKNEPDLDLSNNQISSFETINPSPTVIVSNITVFRQSGLTATFNIGLSSPLPQPVQLFCTTSNGSALSPRDYLAVSRTFSIPAGATNTTFAVTIQNNGQVESNVVFFLNISLSSTGAPIATGSCTLLNNNFYAFSITNISLTAGLSGPTNAVFTVSLSGSNYAAASVDYFTRDASAVSGTDYLAKAGTLVFPPGVTNGTVSIPVYATPDTGFIKTFYLILANPVTAVLAAPQATASILHTNFPLVIGPSQRLPDGRFQLSVNGGALGQRYVLLASTNLVNWTPIIGFVDTNPPVTIYDQDAAQYSRRFYRIGPLSLAPLVLGLNGEEPFNSNGFSGILYALPGFQYEIDASTNLSNWQPVTNITGTNAPFYFMDSNATNFNRRFYRAKIK